MATGTEEAVRLVAGEADGFDRLYDEHVGRALRLAGLLVGRREAAEDAVAEGFARVLPRWRDGLVDDFWPYLRAAVVNHVRDAARREATVQRWLRGATAGRDAPGADDGMPDRMRLATALDRLPPRQRQVVVLRYLEDLSEAETATLLGCSVGTVKSSVSRGVARLRDLLEEEEQREDFF